MTTPDEPTSATERHPAEHVPREQLWDRVQNADRNWSPDRNRDEEPEPEQNRPANGPSRVLVPFDDSVPACAALEYAVTLFPDADVTALAVVDESAIGYLPNPSDGPDASAAGGLLAGMPTELEHAIEIAERHDSQVRTAGRVGPPTQEILAFLEDEPVEHVVIGSHSRSGIARVLQGSVAEVVVRHSPVPVTVVPASAGRLEGPEASGGGP